MTRAKLPKAFVWNNYNIKSEYTRFMVKFQTTYDSKISFSVGFQSVEALTVVFVYLYRGLSVDMNNGVSRASQLM